MILAAFTLDWMAILFAGICLGAFFVISKWIGKKQRPALFFSSLKQFPGVINWKERFAKMPKKLLYLALTFFFLAFLDPHLYLKDKKLSTSPDNQATIPTEGLAIYLLVDRSGSMSEHIEVKTSEKYDEFISKMDYLKKVTQTFIQNRTNDLFGLVAFARAPLILSPLTLDHQIIEDYLSSLEVVREPDQNGTAIGYAIYKTVNMIAATRHFGQQLASKGKPTYTIENAIIVVVTDGFQYPSPLDKDNRLRNIDLDEAGDFAREQHVKVYLINIDPNISDPEYQPQRNQMKRITEMTGGRFFMMSESSLDQIYSVINKLEKGKIADYEAVFNENESFATLKTARTTSFFPFFVSCGMLLLFFSILLQCTIFKTIP